MRHYRQIRNGFPGFEFGQIPWVMPATILITFVGLPALVYFQVPVEYVFWGFVSVLGAILVLAPFAEILGNRLWAEDAAKYAHENYDRDYIDEDDLVHSYDPNTDTVTRFEYDRDSVRGVLNIR